MGKWENRNTRGMLLGPRTSATIHLNLTGFAAISGEV